MMLSQCNLEFCTQPTYHLRVRPPKIHFRQGKWKLIITPSLKEERKWVQAKLLCKEVGKHDETIIIDLLLLLL